MHVLTVDIGTASVRAAVVAADAGGALLAKDVQPIPLVKASPSFVVSSSGAIWASAVAAIRNACTAAITADGQPLRIGAIGVDAACSLVLLPVAPQNVTEEDPISVLPADQLSLTTTLAEGLDTIVWMDHRAEAEARDIDAAAAEYKARTGDDVLRSVGGTISPEMQIPKLLWMRRHMPAAYARIGHAFDLSDWLVYRLTGEVHTRSMCTTTCKWLLQHRESGPSWPMGFFASIGLIGGTDEDEAGPLKAMIGTDFAHLGTPVGNGVCAAAVESLGSHTGIAAGCPVSAGAIDAHAGGIAGMAAATTMAASCDGSEKGEEAEKTVSRDHDDDNGVAMEEALVVIAGTSSCHMAVTQEPDAVPGVWGPYPHAMVPGLWLTEGGLSASGALIDEVLRRGLSGNQAVAGETTDDDVGTMVQQCQEYLFSTSSAGGGAGASSASTTGDMPKTSRVATMTRHTHIGSDWCGNRSPLAVPELRGTVMGCELARSLPVAAVEYLSAVQSVAYATRHVVEAINAGPYRQRTGHRIRRMVVCGGGAARDALYLQQHADATGLPVIPFQGADAMLLGAAALAVSAAAHAANRGRQSSNESPPPPHGLMHYAMRLLRPAPGPSSARTGDIHVVNPCEDSGIRDYHDRKYAVYRLLQDTQLRARDLMKAAA